jgi:phage I-like protein
MDDYTVLLDAPTVAAGRLQVAALGDFKSKRYGQFSITRDDVASWRRHLPKLPGGRAPIDLDHSGDRPSPHRNTEAAAWITGLELEGDKPMAQIEWTPVGKSAVEEKRYMFFSPTYGDYTDEHGDTHSNALLGGALTNRPFLGSMPAVTLASDERVSAALDQDPATRFFWRALDGDMGDEAHALVMLDVSAADRDRAHANNNSLPDKTYAINNVAQLKAAAILAASHHGDWEAAQTLIKRRAGELGVDITTLAGFGSGPASSSDSRRSMDNDLLKTLGLDGDADLVKTLDALDLDEESTQKLLGAATDLRTRADAAAVTEPTAPRTLEQQAADAGKIILDHDTLITLQRDAQSGAAAMRQLHEDRFETAFTRALEDPAGARVIPAEKDDLKHFYELDADATIKLIDARQPIVSAKPKGDPRIKLEDDDRDPRELAADGVNPGNHDVHKQVMAELKRLDKPMTEYPNVLNRVLEGGQA